MSSGPWPKHQSDYWNNTLDHARAHGWHLDRNSAHSWGQLRCSTGGCSRITIYSTAKGAESFAGETRKKVDKCPHGSVAVDALLGASDRLNQAELLIEAGENLIGRHAAHRALEMLGGLENELEVLEFESRLEELLTEIDICESQIRSQLVEAGIAIEPVPSLLKVGEIAHERVREAQDALASAPPRLAATKALKTRLVDVKARLKRIRASLKLGQ